MSQSFEENLKALILNPSGESGPDSYSFIRDLDPPNLVRSVAAFLASKISITTQHWSISLRSAICSQVLKGFEQTGFSFHTEDQELLRQASKRSDIGDGNLLARDLLGMLAR